MDYYITETQHDMLEHVKDYYANRLKLSGGLDSGARTEMLNRLTTMGFKEITIGVFDYDGNEMGSSDIKVRNIEDVDESVMKLVVSVKPKYKPFLFGKLLGLKENDEFFFKVGGEVLSERPMF